MKAVLALTSIMSLAYATGASAAVVGTAAPQTITADAPITIILDSDTSYTFSLTLPGAPQNQSVVSASTSGDAMIYGNGDFFGGRPASLQFGTVIPTQLSLGEFKSYISASAIDFSVAVTNIALQFMLNDGLHFGYAQVGGDQLLAFGFETDVGAAITTGAEITGPFPVNDVPEPNALVLIGFGVLALAGASRRVGA